MGYQKKNKKEVRPCVRCKENHLIYNRSKWLCQECDKEITKERRGDLQSLFLEIWKERSHYCAECKSYLGEEPLAIFFSHDHSRGARPDLKMDKNNITLLCGECHYKHDFGNKEIKR